MNGTLQLQIRLSVSVRRYLFLIVLLSGLNTPWALSGQSSNLERIESITTSLLDSLIVQSGIADGDVCVRVVDHMADWLVYQSFNSASLSSELNAIDCGPGFPFEFLVAITDLDVIYVELDDEEFYRREISMELSASIPIPDRTSSNVKNVTSKRSLRINDTIEVAQASSLETADYPFTQGRVVPLNRKPGFWKRIAEPAIVIGTTIATIVLLFTTRGG